MYICSVRGAAALPTVACLAGKDNIDVHIHIYIYIGLTRYIYMCVCVWCHRKQTRSTGRPTHKHRHQEMASEHIEQDGVSYKPTAAPCALTEA